MTLTGGPLSKPKGTIQQALGPILALFALVMLLSNVVGLSQPPSVSQLEAQPVVAFIPVVADVNYSMKNSVERALRRAEEAGATYIVLELDTYGGLVDSAEDIHSLLFGVKNAKTIAFVTKKAISAGALIALSCNRLVMKDGTRIGDVAPLLVTPQGAEEAGEKFQTELRAVFRTNAERNGYPAKLSEAMVSKDMEVLRVTREDGSKEYLTGDEVARLSDEERSKIKKTEVIVPKGQLLTMTSKEAKDLGFADAVVESREELLKFYGLESAKVLDIKPTWSQDMARVIERWGFVFLALGILGMYVELKTPGFGLPGILGIACLLLFFFGKYLAGLAEVKEIVFFVIGVGLLALEIFVLPGFGVAGILGILFILISIYLASLPFWVPRGISDFRRLTTWAWQLSAAVGGVIVVAIILARFLPKTGLPGKLTITARETAAEGYVAGRREDEGLEGKRGISVTKLRPAGKAEIQGRVLDVVAEGDFIDKGESVKVISARGTRVVVRKA